MESAEGNFDLAFGLFTDNTFLLPQFGFHNYRNIFLISSSDWRTNENQGKQDEKNFNVPEMMHVGATVDSSEMFVQLQECWATPSSDPNDVTKYIFIENFCGTDEEVNVYESLIVAQNGVANQAQFSMESFVFNDSTDAIYLHCNVSQNKDIFTNPGNTSGLTSRTRLTFFNQRYICAIQQPKIAPSTAAAKMQESEEVVHPLDQLFQVREFLFKNPSDLSEDENYFYHK